MKVAFVVVLLLAGFSLLGCDTKPAQSVTPSYTQANGATWESNVTWKWIDGTHIEKTYTLSRMIHGQKVDIGPIKFIYVCDYPMNAAGPPAPGHCYTNGTGCVD